MASDVADLARMQTWLQSAITDPAAPAGPEWDDVSPSSSLPASEGLAIYRRAYSRRLLSYMATMHPALRHALGERPFDDVMLGYLDAHRPGGHSLARLDEALPEYLAGGRGGTDVLPVEIGVAREFLVDLARLERNFHEVWDGDGAESPRLVGARFPVGSYLDAVRRGEHPDPPPPAATVVVLTRRSCAVVVTEVGPGRLDPG